MNEYRVHHEAISNGEAERWALVLHGVFGRGANWRLFCKRVVAERPEWGFALVDLRGHGASQHPPPPHDLAGSAADLAQIEERLTGPVRAVIGHSLGGNVALTYAAQRRGLLDQVWVVDSQPRGRGREGKASPARAVHTMLQALSVTFADRASFVRAVMDSGYDKGLASWLAMSLKRDGETFRLQLDLEAIGAILVSYFETDLWPEVERDDPHRELHFIVGGKSFALDADDRARLERIGEEHSSVFVHTFPQAGHWVHTDAPGELQQLLVDRL